MLIHKGNILPSIPTARSIVRVKGTYENMDLLLKAVRYSKYGWKICGDLRVIVLLLRMQCGHTNF